MNEVCRQLLEILSIQVKKQQQLYEWGLYTTFGDIVNSSKKTTTTLWPVFMDRVHLP